MMDRLLTTILLVTDCSDDAPLAARVAADLAVKTGATLHLVYTWAPVTLDAYSVPGLTAASVDQDCFEAARGVLTLSVRLLERQGATISGQYLRIGRAADEISALVATPGADLIVVGSRGSGPSPDPLLGTDADGIVRMATCPVLFVRGHSTSWPPSRIAVGDDGSSDAARTVGFAVSLGRVLNVETMLARALAEPVSGSCSILALAERAVSIQACGGRTPATVTATCAAAEFLCETVAAGGQPALLVIGNRGSRFSGQPHLGRVATKIIRTAPGSVLIVPRRHDYGAYCRPSYDMMVAH